MTITASLTSSNLRYAVHLLTNLSPIRIRWILHTLIGFVAVFPNHRLLRNRFKYKKRLISVLSVLILFICETSRRRRSDLPSIPCTGQWIWGHLVTMGWTHRHSRIDYAFTCARFVLDHYRSWTYSLTMPFISTFVMTNHPANLEYILKTNHQNFVKGHIFRRNNQPLLGHGIFNVDGDLWRVQRKSASHIFNVKNFRDHMFTIFSNKTSILATYLNETCTDQVVDMYDLLNRFTLDSFMEIGFGTSTDSFNDPSTAKFAAAFDTAQKVVAVRMVRPYYLTKAIEFVSRTGRDLAKSMDVINEFAERIIRARKQALYHHNELDSSQYWFNDLLSNVMMINNPETNAPFSDSELRDFVVNFIIAGRDTTAQAISWTLYVLSIHPTVVRNIRAEIQHHFGQAFVTNNGIMYLQATPQNYTTLTQSMVYTRAVISEALRLYPSVPIEAKVVVNDDQLPDGTKVYAGERVVWSPWAMGRLQEIWGVDVMAFKPERWIDADGHFIQHNAYKYPVFNAGPRTCLGQHVAYLESTLCLITLLHNFEFVLANNEPVQYGRSLTLPMKNGLKVRVSRSTCAL